MKSLAWKIVTYETTRKEKPLDEFIKKQQPQAQAKIIHSVRLLTDYGNLLALPHARMLGSGLFELRIRGKEEFRIFYCFHTQNTIYLLHAFKKQTQKTPHKELAIARKRQNELTTI